MQTEEKTRLGRRRIYLRRLLLVAVWLVTLIALFYAEENWRARKAWLKYKQRVQAQGIPLELPPLIPKRVPDDQNFAMTPYLAPLFDFVPGTQQWRDPAARVKLQTGPLDYKRALNALKSSEDSDGDWGRGISINLNAWQLAFDRSSSNSSSSMPPDRVAAAKAVLDALQEWTPVLNELRSASQRPYSRFNIYYEDENSAAILLPHLAVLQRLVNVLKLRASAELATGQSAPAVDDIDLALKITNATKDEPILISMVVRMAELRRIIQPIWEGLAARKWSDEQLKALQQGLSTFDVLSDAQRGLLQDRAGLGNSSIEFVRKSPSKRADMVGLLDNLENDSRYEPFASILLQLVPSGWFYSEELEYNRISDQYVTPLIDLTNRVVSPQVAANTQQAVQSLLSGDPFRLLRQHRLFARLLVPAVSALSIKFARTQTAVDLATTACAIERYQLANGHYPENLQQLVPTFIAKVPKDVIDGNPLRYRTEKDRFVLYSIGWNATDDSGAYPLKPEREISELRGSGNDRPESGDWAWRYPAAD